MLKTPISLSLNFLPGAFSTYSWNIFGTLLRSSVRIFFFSSSKTSELFLPTRYKSFGTHLLLYYLNLLTLCLKTPILLSFNPLPISFSAYSYIILGTHLRSPFSICISRTRSFYYLLILDFRHPLTVFQFIQNFFIRNLNVFVYL